MSKDLSKEYKEAVMNDLPDLWGKIEAALDAEEAAGKTEALNSNNTETPVVSKIENNEETKNAPVLKAVENNQGKMANNVSASTPVKKKKKFPMWIFAAVPSAAILLLAVVPLLFFGGLAGSNSAKTAMSDAASEAPASYDSYAEAADSYYEDSELDVITEAEEAVFEEASSEISEDADHSKKNDTAGIDNNAFYTATSSGETDNKNIPDISQLTQGDDGAAVPGTISGDTTDFIRSETETAIVKIFLIYTDDEEYVAFSIVEEVIGDERICSDYFNGFEKGDSFDAYIDSETEFEEGLKYKVIIRFESEDSHKFHIEKIEEISESN